MASGTSEDEDLAAALAFVRIFPEAQSHKVLLLTPAKDKAIVNKPAAATDAVLREMRRPPIITL